MEILNIPYRTNAQTYIFGSDSSYKLEGETLQFLKILKNNYVYNNKYNIEYVDSGLTIQKFYYNETFRDIDSIINKMAIANLKRNYYTKTANEYSVTIASNLNKHYDYYTALNTVNAMNNLMTEFYPFRRRVNLDHPSQQNIFYQMYNDQATLPIIPGSELTVSDDNKKFFCIGINNILQSTIPSNIETDYRTIYKVFLLATVKTGKIQCYVECRNIKVPYKVIKIGTRVINNNTEQIYLCIAPKYLLETINKTIFRKFIFTEDDYTFNLDNSTYILKDRSSSGGGDISGNGTINRTYLNANVLIQSNN